MGVHEEVESETEENLVSDEEIEAEDFERTPRLSGSVPEYVRNLTSSSPVGMPSGSNVLPRRAAMARSGSMATVRLQRRAKLAEKLKDVFELKEIDEVWAEMPCWLLRSVRECPGLLIRVYSSKITLLSLTSATRVHVSNQQLSLFLRPYAFQRSETLLYFHRTF
jgi:hypothetical protein